MTPELREKIETLHALAERGLIPSLIHEDLIVLAYEFVKQDADPSEHFARRTEELFAKYVK